MSIETLVQESVGRMQAAAGVEAIGDRLRELIAALIDNFQNIDEEEAAAILARIEAAVLAFSAGRWIVGGLALAAAFRLYRAAIKTPVPTPVV
jgi:hypothetical protein